jgi:hypothetical protein
MKREHQGILHTAGFDYDQNQINDGEAGDRPVTDADSCQRMREKIACGRRTSYHDGVKSGRKLGTVSSEANRARVGMW